MMKRCLLLTVLFLFSVLTGGVFAGEVLVPTVGSVDSDVANVLTKRRVTIPDRDSAYVFSPFGCVRCHSTGPGGESMEAPVFYGNPEFSKDQWEPVGTGVTIRNFDWEDVGEHEDIFKKGVKEKDLLDKSL